MKFNENFLPNITLVNDPDNLTLELEATKNILFLCEWKKFSFSKLFYLLWISIISFCLTFWNIKYTF